MQALLFIHLLSHLCLWSCLGHRPQTSFPQASRFRVSFFNYLAICFPIAVPCIFGPSPLLLFWVVPGKGLSCNVGCRFMSYPSPAYLKDIYFIGLLVCSLLQFFIRNLVWSADHKDLHEAGID